MQADGFPLANVLPADDIQAEFKAEAVSLSDLDLSPYDDVVDTPAITLWARGRHISEMNSGDYCRAWCHWASETGPVRGTQNSTHGRLRVSWM